MQTYMLRLQNKSNSLVWFKTIKQNILYRLRKGGTDQAIVEAIDKVTSFTYPTFCNVHKNIVSKVLAIYIQLPYHQVWASDINKGLHALLKRSEFGDLVQVFVVD